VADSNIKKIRILKKDLPAHVGNSSLLSYKVRYRIVSEDKNRSSHWSPFFEVGNTSTLLEVGFDPSNPTTTSIKNVVTIDKSAHQASITWTLPALLITNPTEAEKILQKQQAEIKNFDVYVRWKTGLSYSDWQWKGLVNANNFSMAYPEKVGGVGPDYIQFAVQKVTQIKQRWDSATYLVTTDNAL
jgi:hypothetical protein